MNHAAQSGMIRDGGEVDNDELEEADEDNVEAEAEDDVNCESDAESFASFKALFNSLGDTRYDENADSWRCGPQRISWR
jgi:hypothetical protein